MRKTLPLLVLLLSLGVFAQTPTYTVTQNACGMKSSGMCQLSVVDQNNHPGYVTLDNRSPYRTGYLDLGTFGQNEYHGSYAFPAPPSGNGTPLTTAQLLTFRTTAASPGSFKCTHTT